MKKVTVWLQRWEMVNSTKLNLINRNKKQVYIVKKMTYALPLNFFISLIVDIGASLSMLYVL